MAEAPAVHVFDDRVADGFAPFALTRPCGEIPYGRWTVRERVERAFGSAASHVTRPWLRGYREPGTRGVVPASELGRDGVRIFWSSRAVADPPASPAAPANLRVAGELAGLALPDGAPPPEPGWFAEPSPIADAPDVEIEGEWLRASWDLVSGGPERLLCDLERNAEVAGVSAPRLEGVHRIGDAPFLVGDGAVIEPGVLVDTRAGPVELGPGVEVRTGTRLAGPLYAGPNSRLLGGSISTLSAGPYSYLRGEIDEAAVFGYANKAHDGFLGHAVLGAWVNLGAMTTNSDLKNNYGTVRVGPPDAAVDTGLVKLGCLIGDHVKTGIGTLLDTGTILGAGSNVFGGEMPPKWVPPFSWGRGEGLSPYRRDAFLATAATVLPRRGVPADDETLAWLGAVWDKARG